MNASNEKAINLHSSIAMLPNPTYTARFIFALVLSSLVCLTPTHGFWFTGMVGSITSQKGNDWQDRCDDVEGLTPSQQSICYENPDHMQSVAVGAYMALRECQHQFRTDKWNCSMDKRENNVFGAVAQSGYKETAFIHAISSAGVAFAIARNCREGQLSKCGCSEVLRPKDLQPSDLWGSCGDNVAYGVRSERKTLATDWNYKNAIFTTFYQFSKKFVDAKEKERNHPRNSNGLKLMLMNLHNNDVGRMVVYRSAEITCKCHGVSGSCAARTCWHLLPNFRKVGNALREMYNSSLEADFNKRGNRLEPREPQKTRRSARSSESDDGKDAFFFVESSPDYCERNETTGIYGTTGRECQKNSKGPDSCKTLCCGRGFNVVRTTQMSDCRCVFLWCCKLECEKCRTNKITYTCK